MTQARPITTRRFDRPTDTLARRLDRASEIIPSIRDHLSEQRANISVLAAKVTDDMPSSRGSYSDPTGALVLLNDSISTREAAIDDMIATIKLGVDLLDEACRDALAWKSPHDLANPEPVTQRPRCKGDGEAEGSTCTQIPIERTDLHTGQRVDDGRCLDCGPRYDKALARKAEEAQRRRLARHAS